MKSLGCLPCLILATFFHRSLEIQCDLKVLDWRRYTVPLWGKRVTQSCQQNEYFDVDSCQCVRVTHNKVSKITGGLQVSHTEVPWSLSLYIGCKEEGKDDEYNPVFTCSAVLVEWRWAVTAKSCVSDTRAREACEKADTDEKDWKYIVKARSDTTKDEKDEIQAFIVKIYHLTDSDLGLVLMRLQIDITQHEDVTWNELPYPGESLSNRICYQLGFGNQDRDKNDEYLYWSSTYLLKSCPNEIAGIPTKPGMLCTLDRFNGGNLCPDGDLGGGLFCHHGYQGTVLMGVAVLINDDCVKDGVSGYASTAQWYNKINEQIRKEDGTDRCTLCTPEKTKV